MTNKPVRSLIRVVV